MRRSGDDESDDDDEVLGGANIDAFDGTGKIFAGICSGDVHDTGDGIVCDGCRSLIELANAAAEKNPAEI